MKAHENQITDYPKGARIETIREIPLCSPTQNYYADPLPQGTRGTVIAHTDDGRAWINFDGQGQGLLGHTFEQPEKYIRVVCTHRDDNCPANHEQPSKTEFDQVFDQMEAPGYPATCDNCGEVGTNASMEQHVCTNQNHDAPAAPERGEWAIDPYSSCEVVQLDVAPPHLADRIAQTYGGSKEQRAQRAAQICYEHNQHSTLIAQRERLLVFVKEFADKGCVCNGETCLQRKIHPCIRCRASELITTSEQERR